MDLAGFREAQSPWFFSQPPTYLVESRVDKTIVPNKNTLPTKDDRYPEWAAVMNDGRLVTDYRSKCEVNIPTGAQLATRVFMQRNGNEIIQKSRRRQAETTGAGQPYNRFTELPTQYVTRCDTAQCTTGLVNEHGLGTGRLYGSTPDLFGTFAPSRPSITECPPPPITTVYEGGRNTPRRA